MEQLLTQLCKHIIIANISQNFITCSSASTYQPKWRKQ